MMGTLRGSAVSVKTHCTDPLRADYNCSYKRTPQYIISISPNYHCIGNYSHIQHLNFCHIAHANEGDPAGLKLEASSRLATEFCAYFGQEVGASANANIRVQ